MTRRKDAERAGQHNKRAEEKQGTEESKAAYKKIDQQKADSYKASEIANHNNQCTWRMEKGRLRGRASRSDGDAVPTGSINECGAHWHFEVGCVVVNAADPAQPSRAPTRHCFAA